MYPALSRIIRGVRDARVGKLVTKKRYFSIALLWILIPSILGFLAALAGAGQGGASVAFFLIGISFGVIGAGAHIVILSLTKGSILQKIVVPAICVAFGLFVYHEIMDGLLKGYHLVDNRTDDVHLTKNGSTIVKSTIVSLDTVSKYIVGLRLPSQHLECENGGALKIRVLNEKMYFIVDTMNGEVDNITDEQIFLNRLEKLDIKSEIELDFSAFDKIWNRYSGDYDRYDYATCVELY